MDLIPPTYACPTHQHDLTDLVKEALDEAGPPVAFDRRRLRGRAVSAHPFEVIITCPGTTPDDPAHQLTCTGRYR